MSPLDLRLKYKTETGYYPCYNEYCDVKGYRGKFSRFYVEWLGGKELENRLSYLRETGEDFKDHFEPKTSITYYTTKYALWMEERQLKQNPA